jgi:TonB family protein
MSTELIWNNLVAYSLQIGLLVGLAAFVPALLRLRLPGAKLAYWHILLAACLLLPAIRPWKRAVVNGDVQVTTTVLAVAPSPAKTSREIPTSQIALLLLIAGGGARLAWLALGLWRLRRYRRHSRPFGLRDGCSIFLSEDVSSPVTFGALQPVILLPAGFPELDARMQQAILCHELLHVERHDWLFTVTEELVRAAFWFHPAIWWLLGEIQLAREQAVDRAVVERTQARDEYVDALLAIAGASPQLDLAPASLFLRKRHLKQRVVSILKEVRMSKTRLISGLAAGLGILCAACWFVTGTFPLAAAPQVVTDGPGVTVEISGAALLHRSPVGYPETARAAGVQGTVAVEAVLDGAGNVNEARILSGPQELRKAAQQSVLAWHFKPDAAGATRVVNITFQLQPTASEAVRGGNTVVTVAGPEGSSADSNAQREKALARFAQAQQEMQQRATRIPVPPPSPETRRTLKSINIVGLSEQMKSDLLSRLPVREGDELTKDTISRVTQVVKEFDEHLRVTASALSGETVLSISTPDVPVAPDRIRIGGNVQQAKLIKQPHPVYPQEAKDARVQGTVKLQATIGKDGTVQSLEVISGPSPLVPAALDAVRQWVYQTTLLNGNPVEVVTQIDVNFTLSQ